MMISDTQLAALDSRMLDQFSREVFLRLEDDVPDWQHSGSGAVRQQQVADILRYGRQLQLEDAADLYRFTEAIVRFGLPLPLPQALAGEFRQADTSRAAQVESLLLRLLSGRDGKTPIHL